MKEHWPLGGLVAVIAILAFGAVAQDSASPEKEYQQLVKKFDNEREAYFKTYREAKTEEERKKTQIPGF